MRTFRITYVDVGAFLPRASLRQTYVNATDESAADETFRRTFNGCNMVRIERQIGYIGGNEWETLYQHPDLDPPRFSDDDE